MTIFLRKPVVELLRRTTSAEGFGAKLTFAERIEGVRETVEQVQEAHPVPPQQLDADQSTVQPTSTPDALRELTEALATSSASGSVIAAWAELERGFRAIAETNDLSWDTRNFMRNLHSFKAMGFIPDWLIEAVQSLRRIRNDVAHGLGSPPTLEEAASFRATVEDVLETVDLNAGLHRWR